MLSFALTRKIHYITMTIEFKDCLVKLRIHEISQRKAERTLSFQEIKAKDYLKILVSNDAWVHLVWLAESNTLLTYTKLTTLCSLKVSEMQQQQLWYVDIFPLA